MVGLAGMAAYVHMGASTASSMADLVAPVVAVPLAGRAQGGGLYMAAGLVSLDGTTIESNQ